MNGNKVILLRTLSTNYWARQAENSAKKGDFDYFDRIAELFSDCPASPNCSLILLQQVFDLPRGRDSFLTIVEFAQTNACLRLLSNRKIFLQYPFASRQATYNG